MVNKGRSASFTSSWDRQGQQALSALRCGCRTLICYRVLSTQTFRISFFFSVRYRPPPSRVTPNLVIARGTLFVVNLFRLVKLAQTVLFAQFKHAEFPGKWPAGTVRSTVRKNMKHEPRVHRAGSVPRGVPRTVYRVRAAPAGSYDARSFGSGGHVKWRPQPASSRCGKSLR